MKNKCNIAIRCLLVIVTIFLVMLPFICHFCCENIVFGADGILGYYGALLGASATMITVYFSMRYNTKTIQNTMKEQRIRQKYNDEKEIIKNVNDVILLQKYNDPAFSENRSVPALAKDLDGVYFEALARIPIGNGSPTKKEAFYSTIYSAHAFYKKELDKIDYTGLAAMDQSFQECRSNISGKRNEIQDELWFSERAALYEVTAEMNAEIDALYGINKEVPANDNT